jgi:hypothetical protein
MAATTFNTAPQAALIREPVQTLLIGLRETLDAFVSYRMRQAAAEAEIVRDGRKNDRQGRYIAAAHANVQPPPFGIGPEAG